MVVFIGSFISVMVVFCTVKVITQISDDPFIPLVPSYLVKKVPNVLEPKCSVFNRS